MATAAQGCSNATLGAISENSDSPVGSMSQITIASTGNSVNFGDLSVARATQATGSSAHGGIQ